MPLTPESLIDGYGTDDMNEDVESVERASVMGTPLSPSSLLDIFPVGAETDTPEDKIRASYKRTRGTSPDQAARDLEMSEKLGVESGLVQRNREQLAEEEEIKRLQDVSKDRPALQRVLETPEGMAASKDDVETLAMIEDSFGGWIGHTPIESVKKGQTLTDVTAGLAKGTLKGAAKGTVSILGVMPYNFLAYVSGGLDDAATGIEGITGGQRGGAFGMVRDWALANARSIQEGIVESELLELSDDAKGQLIDKPELLLNPEWLADNVSQAVANVLAMAGAAYATGGGSLAAAAMGAMAEAGQLYNDLLADGVDGPTAHIAATGFGAVVAALEKVGADRWLGKERVKSLASRIVKSTVTGVVEAGTEWAEEPTGAFIESLAKGESLETAAERAAVASRNIDVMVGAFAAGGGMAYVGKYRNEQKLAERAQRNKDFFQQLNEGVEASKLRERSTGIFKTYAQSIEEMGVAPESVYIPVEQLQNAIADDEAFAALLKETGTSEQLDAAVATGGDIAFPLSEFMTHVAGTDAGVALENDFRFDPNEMTPREAKSFVDNMPELFADGFEEAQQQAEKLIAEEEQGREVRDFVKSALLGVGMSEEEADANAAIWGARAIIAARDYSESGMKMTPQEWLKEKNIVVKDDKTGRSMSVSGLMEGARAEGQGFELPQTSEVTDDDGRSLYQSDEGRGYRGTPYTREELEKLRLTREKDDYYFHGSNSAEDAFVVEDDGVFDGLFVSGSLVAAESHGDYVHVIKLNNDEILSSSDLAFSDEANAEIERLAEIYDIPLDSDEYSLFEDLIFEYENLSSGYSGVSDEMVEYFEDKLGESGSDLGWKIQRLRGQVARAVVGDYKAVEMEDEHGTSYLVFPGVETVRLKSDTSELYDYAQDDSLFDDSEKEFQQSEQGESRGSVRFEGDRTLVRMFKRADRSTFLHETAHIFLDDFRTLAKSVDVSERIQKEWATLEEYWEKSRSIVYKDAMKVAKEGFERSKKRYEKAESSGDKDLKRFELDFEEAQRSYDKLKSDGADSFSMSEDGSYYADWVWAGQQEVFARSFETYVREGKAPSLELGKAFQRFKKWLLAVYRSMRRLNVNLSDDVLGLMDRMLATEEQIAEAEAFAEYAPLYTSAEEAGMTDAEFAIYSGAHSEAREKAREIMLAKMVRKIKDRNKRWYKEERARIEAEIKDGLYASRGYRAVHYLSKGYFPDESKPEKTGGAAEADTGHMRISTDAIKKEWGEGTLADLYKAVPPVHSKKGVHPDVLASFLGYSSGDELIQELANLRPLREVVEEDLNSMMKEFEDLMPDESVKEEAEAAIREDARIEMLAIEQEIAERKILSEQKKIAAKEKRQAAKRERELQAEFAGEDFGKFSLSAFSEHNRRIARERVKRIREAAKQTIGRMKVTEAVKYTVHQRAERKAARDAIEAAKKGDLRGVADAKQRQLLAAALTSESLKAKDEVEKARKYLGKFNKPATRKAIARDQLDQIDQILERFDLRKSTTLTEIERRESLAKWLDAQRQKGFEPDIPPVVESEANRISYKVLPLDSLRDIRDAVKSIETVGRRLESVMTARKKRLFNETVSEMVRQIELLYGDKLGPERISREAAKKGVGSIFKGIDASLTKVEFLCLALDGGKANGLWWDMLYRPIKEGVNNKMKRLFESRNEIYGPDIFGRYTKDELARFNTKKIFIKEISDSLTKEQILAVALNRGNSHNWESLLIGEEWTEEQGDAVLARLDERDWDVVEKIWEHVDSFWPDIAALYRRLNGTVPEKVIAEPFEIGGRKMRGGYYPLVADRELSVKAAQREDAKSVQEMFGSGGFAPTTRNGHTKKRESFGGQRVALKLDVLIRHIDQVTHDIYLREAVIDVDRLLQDGRIQNVIIRAVGREQYDQLRPWLSSVAGQNPYDYDDLQGVAKLLRKNATFAIMGLKATVFVSQYAGLLNAIPIMQNGLKAGKAKISARMFKHLMQLVKSPSGKLGKLIDEKSLEMRDRRHNFTQEMHDISSNFGFGKKIKKWQEALMYFTALADFHVSGASWVAAYELALEEGKTEQQAIDFADSVVTMGQGSGKEKDISAIQRGNEYKRMWMMFFSYMNTNYNQITSAVRTLRIGKRKGKFLGELAFYWMFPTIAAELLAGRGPDEDDDESWLSWGAYKIMMHPTGMIPVVRDAIRVIEDDYGRPVSLVGRVGSSLKRAGKEYLDDDGDDAALFWSAVEVGSYFVPFPSAQARITIGQLIEYMNDERETYNPLFYQKK